MIRIFSRGDNVVVEVDYKYPGNGFYTSFENNAGNKLDSILRAENLRDNLQETIQRIRKEEYNRGWKDAKSKNKKEEYFKVIF